MGGPWTPKSIQQFLDEPAELAATDPWRQWLLDHGGLPAVREGLRALPLRAGHPELLNLFLAFPGEAVAFYSAKLNLDRSTYHRWKNNLFAHLAQLLNDGFLPPVEQPEPVRIVLPAPAKPAPRRVVLPAQPNPLLGREAERAALGDLIRNPAYRLITLLGAGGIGKTRLALQIGWDTEAAFADGAVFVEMAPLREAEMVLPHIAQALGLSLDARRDVASQIQAHLQQKHMLLIADNLEHVLDCGPALGELARAAPQVTILATSRIHLDVYGEHLVAISPLNVPPHNAALTSAQYQGYAAIQLFLARIPATLPAPPVTLETLRVIHAICWQLDGLALAIELAAAQMRDHAPEFILSRLSERLSFLTNGPRDVHTRQQTLIATLDWSYDLLPTGVRAVFNRLGVFHGSWTIEAAAAVCPDLEPAAVSQAHEILASHHMIYQPAGSAPGARFDMLETVRDYARARFAADPAHDAVEERWAAFYCQRSEELEALTLSDQQHVALREYAADDANLHAVLAWAQAHGAAETGARICDNTWRYWLNQSLIRQGWEWISSFLPAEDQLQPLTRGKLLHAAGVLCNAMGRDADADRYWQTSLELWKELGDTAAIGVALNNLGYSAFLQGDPEQAAAYHTESLALNRQLGDQSMVGASLHNLGEAMMLQERHQEALPLLEESLSLRKSCGDLIGWVVTQRLIGELYYYMGRYDEARQALELGISNQTEWGVFYPALFHLLGYVELAQHRYPEARAALGYALQAAQDQASDRNMLFALLGLAVLGRDEEQEIPVLHALAAMDQIQRNVRWAPHPKLDELYRQTLEMIKTAFDPGAWDDVWAQALAEPLEWLLASALAGDDRQE